MKEKKLRTINVNLPGVSPLQKPPRDVDFDSLEHCVIDGKINCKVGDTLILKRDHVGSKAIKNKVMNLCTVAAVHENGDIVLFNDTIGQMTNFNVANPMNARILQRKQ